MYLHYLGVVMIVLQVVTETRWRNENAVIGTSVYAVLFFLYYCAVSLKYIGGVSHGWL